MSITFKQHSLIAIEEQETEHLHIVRGLRHRDTDPYATIPAIPVVQRKRMPPMTQVPKSLWRVPFHVKKVYQDPLLLIGDALDYCWSHHRVHQATCHRITRIVYLPQHLFVRFHYPEGCQSVTYHGHEVTVLGDPALPIDTVWCMGE